MLRSIFFSSLFAAAYAFNNTSNIGNIIGGQSIPSASSYPYMAYVAFPYNGGEVYCGGTLVAPGWVLTQARCVIPSIVRGDTATKLPFSASDIMVRIGSVDHTTGGQVFKVTETVPHPDHSSTVATSPDMALLKLDGKSNVPPVALASSPPPKDASFMYLGWGIRDVVVGQQPRQLKQVSMKQVDDTTKTSVIKVNNMLTSAEDFIIANSTVGEGPCGGDAGGPLLMVDPETQKMVQTAIGSFGLNALHLPLANETGRCAREGDVLVAYRVDKQIEWIQQTTKIPKEQWTQRSKWIQSASSSASKMNHFLLNWLH